MTEIDADDDKNLGRWINRQRSLYQSGKLKEERREELEKIGLKWAVLSTTSWQSMFDSLCIYVKSREDSDKNNKWDGQIPPNYETDEKPPKRLGRWVSRQRAARATDKLKSEYQEKLETLGLSWESNDSKPINVPSAPVHVPVATAVAQVLQRQQPEKRVAPLPPVVAVQKRPLPQTITINQGKTNLPVPLATKPNTNDVPLVASLKPPTPTVVTSMKSPPVINNQSGVVKK